ncbi:PIN domain-like protein [Phycomyces nitens]|nr:PIN domain-like protein [Phycomyces nitens]
MGIRGLTGLLTRFAPNSIRTVNANELAHQTVAFDASCNLSKFVYGDEPHPHRHIFGFFMLARFCEINKIKPIFIFDGASRIPAKKLELDKRARVRHKTNHSLLFEMERSVRLDTLFQSSLNNETLSNDAAVRVLARLEQTLDTLEDAQVQVKKSITKRAAKNSLEARLSELADDINKAVSSSEDREKYTRKIRDLTIKEHDTMSTIVRDQLNGVEFSLSPLISENQHWVASLEKRSIRITCQLREECQNFLESQGYLCFSCEGHEAEAMCAHLGKANRTSATVSEDLDTLVFGDTPIVRHFFSRSKESFIIDPVVARQELGLSRESFTDMCILCGTDFSATIRGIGPVRALQHIQKYGSIENILENLSSKYAAEEYFDYKLAREVFSSLPPIPLEDKSYLQPKVDKELAKFMLDNYEIDSVEVESRIQTIILQQGLTHEWGSDPFSDSAKL